MGQPDKETIQLVLEEHTQEQAKNTKSVRDLVSAVNVLAGKIREMGEKLDKPKEICVSADTGAIEEIMKKGLADMKVIVGTKPLPVIKKYQFLLFPERDAKLFYRVVFGRWFLFLVIMLLLTNLYKFSIHWSDNQMEIRRQHLENDRFKNAWYYLYDQMGKTGKRSMDSAYNKSERASK